MRSCWSLLLTLLVVTHFAVVSPAQAAPRKESAAAAKASAEKLKQAEALYGAGKYLEAAAALEEAQALSPHPRVLYNLARAYDQGGELEKALAAYQQYVSSPEGTDPTLLKRSALSIDRLRGLIAQREEQAKQTEAERARLVQGREEAEARARAELEAKEKAEAEAAIALERRVEEERASRGRARIGAYSLGGLAVGGVAAGVVFGLQASAAKSDFASATTVEDKQRLEDSTRSKAVFADVGFGVGIASAIAAILLYPKGDEPAVTVSSAPGGAGVEVKF